MIVLEFLHIHIPIAKKHLHPCKNLASVIAFDPSKQSYWSKDERTPKFSTVLSAFNNSTIRSKFRPNLATSLVSKYAKNGFQWILKTLLEVQLPTIYGQDQETFKNPPKQTLKSSIPDVYKTKSHINCHNFIEQRKNHLVILRFQNHKRILFTATFVEKRALNWYQ